ncbi:MAG: hypothetical protein IPN88_14675 [Bacteroidetes bacterium]|nr:hypothetical protein [Bacteroidota bacterium]
MHSIDSIFVGQAVAINLAMDSVAALCFGSATGSVSVLAVVVLPLLLISGRLRVEHQIQLLD